jgi:TolB-like protein
MRLSHPSKRLWPVVAVLSLVVAAVALWQIPRLRTPDNITSLAVLPFQQMGGGSRDEYLELGMADALITRLSAVKPLTVRPTSAVRQFSGTPDAVAARKRLGVGAVVDGSVQRLGDRIRVSARLVRVADGKPLWANTYDEPFRDIFSVQDAVSTRIAAALSITLRGEEVSRLSRRYATNTEAYQLYIRGKFFWERRTVENLRKAIALYEQVIQKDPQYAPAYAGLANCYGPLLQWHALRPLEGLPKIEGMGFLRRRARKQTRDRAEPERRARTHVVRILPGSSWTARG